MNPYPLVWVEIGRPIPRYLKRNMKLATVLFPELDQLLVTKGKIWSFSKNHLKLIASYDSSKATRTFYNLKREFKDRDREFWLETTGRFFHLRDAMRSLGQQSYFHMESDVILLEYDAVNSVFNSALVDFVAYPMQSPNIGCASILIVKGGISLDKFLQFAISKWEVVGVSDMTLLGDFANALETREMYLNLPSIFGPVREEGNFIWDAGAIGPYFLGGDARNRRIPVIKRGINSSFDLKGVLESSLWSFQEKNSVSFPHQLVLDGDFGVKNVLVNVHIHSKQIPISPRKLRKFLNRSFMCRKNLLWRYVGIDWTVLLERIFDFLRRRIARLERKVINLR
jgi:hypothetical protein